MFQYKFPYISDVSFSMSDTGFFFQFVPVLKCVGKNIFTTYCFSQFIFVCYRFKAFCSL